MKNFKSLILASAFAAAFAGSANAAPANTLAGANAPSSVGASGSIAKYISFTKTDNAINLGNLGGATATGTWTTGVDITAVPTGAPANDLSASAEVEWDANTHISVAVTNGANLVADGTSGDTLPTQFLAKVKGRGVKVGTATTALTTNNALYTASTGSSAPTNATTYNFDHGPASGLLLDVQATRSGVDDHYGNYSTSVTLNFSDLD